MKKLLTVILVLMMTLSLWGCIAKIPEEKLPVLSVATLAPETAPTTEPTTAPTTEPTAAPTEPPVEEEGLQMGSYESGVYANDFLGLRCALDENWYVYSTEEMAQINGQVIDSMSDEALKEMLQNAGVAYLFFAQTTDGMSTVNITAENLGLIYGTVMDESAYAQAALAQLSAALESAGMTDVTTQAAACNFAGSEHACIVIKCTLSGIDVYEKVVCVKAGNYMGIVTVASYYQDTTDEMLSLFTPA